MAYFGGAGRFAGDPGLFDTFKRLGAAIGRNLPIVGGPIRAAEAIFRRPQGRSVPQIIASPGPTVTQLITPSQQAVAQLGMNGTGGGCPKGMQPAKVHVPGQGMQRVGHCVKVRKRNPYNRRAAMRAASRLKSLGTGLKTVKKSVREADTALSGSRKSSSKAVHVKATPIIHA